MHSGNRGGLEMTVRELIDKLLRIEVAGKGNYEVTVSTQDGACYDVDRIEEGAGWIEFN